MQSSRYARPSQPGGGNSGNNSNSKPPFSSPAKGQNSNILKGVFKNGIWMCDCNPRLPAKKFQVKKDSANKDRWFYTCQQQEGKKCDFFLWEDDAMKRERQHQTSVASLFGTTQQSATTTTTRPTNLVPNDPFTTPSKYATTALERAASSRALGLFANKFEPSRPLNLDNPSISAEASDEPSTQETSTQKEDNDNDSDAKYAPDSDDELALITAAKEADTKVAAVQPQPRVELEDLDVVETPRKAPRTEAFSTPGGKRKFQDMVASNAPTGSNLNMGPTPPSSATDKKDTAYLVTPPTTSSKSRIHGVSSISEPRDGRPMMQEITGLDEAFLDSVSPFTTPTPATRHKNVTSDVPTSLSFASISTSAISVGLTVEEIVKLVKSEDSSIKLEEGDALWKKLEEACHTSNRKLKGIVQSRDITRKVLRAKEVKIEELQHRVKTLEAELDAEREIVKALRENIMD